MPPTPYPQPTGTNTHQLTTLTHLWTPLCLTYRDYHLPIYTHTLKGLPAPTPNPQGVPPTILQHSYTKGTPTPHPLPLIQGVPPTNLQHLYTKGIPHPHPYPNPQGVPPTNLQHSHTNKGPPTLPPTPTHRKYHSSTYNIHTPIKGPTTPHPLPPTHREYHLPTYKTHTLIKEPSAPHPLPPTHRKYHPSTYSTHTLNVATFTLYVYVP